MVIFFFSPWAVYGWFFGNSESASIFMSVTIPIDTVVGTFAGVWQDPLDKLMDLIISKLDTISDISHYIRPVFFPTASTPQGGDLYQHSHFFL